MMLGLGDTGLAPPATGVLAQPPTAGENAWQSIQRVYLIPGAAVAGLFPNAGYGALMIAGLASTVIWGGLAWMLLSSKGHR